MQIIGLTGGIGMGKSTVARLLRRMGFAVYSADDAVHALLKKGGKGVAPVARLFPEAFKRGAIDRKILGRSVFGRPDKLHKLERILHPLARQIERRFVQEARRKKASAVILEIPLLFETGAESRCHLTLCVSAPRAVQKARVLARPGMTDEKLRAILARQMPHAEKRKQASFVIPTGSSVEATEKHLRRLFASLALIS